MSITTISRLRRIAAIAGLLGFIILIVGAFLAPKENFVVGALGAALALVAWLAAVYIGIGTSRIGWLVFEAYLAVVGVVLAIVALVELTNTDERLGAIFVLTFGLLAMGGFMMGVVASEDVVARGLAAALGGAGFVIMIVGGTIIGNSVGAAAAVAGLENSVGDHMYLVSGALGLVAWVVGILTAYRIRAWGWLAFAVLLPGIGSFMFGLFGPSAQDVKQTAANAAAKRAAGVRG